LTATNATFEVTELGVLDDTARVICPQVRRVEHLLEGCGEIVTIEREEDLIVLSCASATMSTFFSFENTVSTGRSSMVSMRRQQRIMWPPYSSVWLPRRCTQDLTAYLKCRTSMKRPAGSTNTFDDRSQ
jgi:hypothetical protein